MPHRGRIRHRARPGLGARQTVRSKSARWLARAINRLQPVKPGMRWDETALRRMLRAGDVAGVYEIRERSGAPARMNGFVLFRTAADEGEILSLAVRPALRRRGIASALVRRAMAKMKTALVRQVFLEVSGSNRAAIALYEALDFTTVGRRRDYYLLSRSRRDDAFVMKHTLN